MIITVDGYAGCGKSSLVKSLSEKLGWTFVSSGDIFRTVTLYLISNNIDINNENEVITALQNINISIKDGLIFLDKKNVTFMLHEKLIDIYVPLCANLICVREHVYMLIKNLLKNENVIIEGRNMGDLFKEAELKIFLEASIEERAKRIVERSSVSNDKYSYSESLKTIKYRDEECDVRYGCLKPNDTIKIDTTNLTKEQVLNKVESYVEEYFKTLTK